VRTCQGCYDAALAYRAPYISGKDSLYNEYNGTPIPGTLLISAIAIVPDMHFAVTASLKAVGNLLYLVGASRDERGGSLLHALHNSTAGAPPTLPVEGLVTYRKLHQAMRAGAVQACHDLSEGGLAVALAEMALGGRLGVDVDLPPSDLAVWALLFGESNGRLVVEVAPEDAATFESKLAGAPLLRLGSVQAAPVCRIAVAGQVHIDLEIDMLLRAWKQQLLGATL
jgi:phosphoribosylformylglycinamidine synthase subunit PurSL